MNHLLRDLAPITPTAWSMLDDEARTRLEPALTARELVDFTGPLGWEHSATPTGRVSTVIPGPTVRATGRSRVVVPLAELRVEFTVTRAELEAADRGAIDVDLSALDDAAAAFAEAENSAVLHGWSEAGFSGIAPATARTPRVGATPGRFARATAAAVARIKRAGVDGPYALALDTESWVDVEAGDEGGDTLLRHLEQILGGPAAWVPGIAGPVVLSQRGGDFALECGQDVSIGYSSHTADSVTFFLEESFSFRVATPEAATPLDSRDE
ncbi:family 1 encapsulin nanocompartment shell protein [Nocardioides sp. CER19]|uniref:family 1 encapsulin nanocompartment shell protein n=1 Tax=Nocardioides sp. CER19 TaxID=3038538 RepID=UPI002449E2AD|nr:family 1 encapsulin nanocompartment shell protein [Nocardioides sp. CER19]MDH2413863.1 family 1 encapsulin nanocompartment shell protein [Nocardioides sp. CER19]